MTRGYEANRQRVAEVNSFGKDLARRSRSRCELCEAAGVPLGTFEVPPVGATPMIERCALLCGDCAEQLSNPRKFRIGEHWRCAAQTIWSEVPAVQVLALRVLRRLAETGTEAWARDVLDTVYVDDEVDAWARDGAA